MGRNHAALTVGQKAAGTLQNMSSKPSDRRPRAVLLALALLGGAALSSCGQEVTGTSTTSGRDALYFADSAAGLPPVYANEAYTGNLTVLGGAGPYTLRVTSGTLPPGLKLSGQTLSGTPTKTGTYKFTVEATDSTLSTKVKEYTLNVNQLPPLSLQPVLPAGQIRGETRIPVTITAPRAARAVRLNWTLPAGAAVTGVQPTEAGGVLFWRVQGQTVTVDVGFKTIPRSGARVALITVKPARAVTLEARMTYEARDGQGNLLTPAPAAAAPATTPAGTPATAPKDGAAPTAPQTTDPTRPQTPGSAPAPASAPAAAPTTPTAPTAPAAPTEPTTPTAPTGPAAPASPVTPPPSTTPPPPTTPGTGGKS